MTDLNHIAEKLDDIEEIVKANHRCLRGQDGDIGLVGRVAIIEKKIDNELKHLEEKVVSWPFLLRSIGLPIGIAIVITVLLKFLGL